jgi:ABC-2 type transport system ATP-binding protein
LISVKNLTKKYNKIIALDNVSLTFDDKKVTAIMGENGAGKTTLLKICSGILSFDNGEINIDGYSIIENPINALKNIGYLPEMPYLYDRLTGREFLYYIGSLRKYNKTDFKIEFFSKELGINAFLDYEIGTYSKGMKQKISLIASIMHNPNNLLLDEPVWGLDPLTSKTLKKFIKKREGTTIIATHSPNLVEEIAHNVYFITKGKIVSSEKVSFYLDKYKSIEEAYFQEAN